MRELCFYFLLREHCHLNATFGSENALCHALNIGCGHIVNHLAVVDIEVGIVVDLVPDDVAPVVVGDGCLGVLLYKILLNLIDALSKRTIIGIILKLLIDDGIKLIISAWVGIIRYLKCGIRLVALV